MLKKRIIRRVFKLSKVPLLELRFTLKTKPRYSCDCTNSWNAFLVLALACLTICRPCVFLFDNYYWTALALPSVSVWILFLVFLYTSVTQTLDWAHCYNQFLDVVIKLVILKLELILTAQISWTNFFYCSLKSSVQFYMCRWHTSIVSIFIYTWPWSWFIFNTTEVL